ncbi:hypothetical protein [Psychrobium sp. 1_MG-2023]|uniref:hypothetical protein n=1 Tax=Psychrobium sp. 1_MG-2023 TaxID=3062624 RepID=UPI000C331AFB|nr:hypothetical protein [Psychrobium sp. 1_MG-2023]MDP2561585.1 hypothetical protein [Psychrobium sp. 1_MG-2023]PKF55045.1 hypothetical protein CW748_14810 [Alteromonadales bacterium alter-6D02]
MTKNKYLRSPLKTIIVSLSAVFLSACYSNWPELDTVAELIACDYSTNQLRDIAQKHGATHITDEASRTISLSKHDDAIAIVINSEREIVTVAKTKSTITMLGLQRQQGDVIVVRRCD